MLIDAQELLADSQAITATAISTKVLDLRRSGAINAGAIGGPTANVMINIGAGTPLFLLAHCPVGFNSAGHTASLTITLESGIDLDLASPIVHATLPVLAEATLVAGFWPSEGLQVPQGQYQRYLGLRFTVGGESFTSGKLSAWLSPTTDAGRIYRAATLTGIN